MRFKGLNKEGKVIYGFGFAPAGNGESYIMCTITDIKDKNLCEDDTICVCTGIQDKEGNYVFDKDIIKMQTGDQESYFVVRYDTFSGCFSLVGTRITLGTLKDIGINFTVVGNMWSDKELLERALKRIEEK